MKSTENTIIYFWSRKDDNNDHKPQWSGVGGGKLGGKRIE